MKTIFSPLHAGHAGQMELIAGEIVPGFEKPARAEIIKARVIEEKLGPVLAPEEHDLAAAIAFTRPTTSTSCRRYGRAGALPANRDPAMGFAWPTRGLRGDVVPEAIEAALGFYSFDAGAGFVAGTWAAVKSAYDVALTAAALVTRRRSRGVRALPPARPPCRAPASWAAIATSTTLRSRRNGCATRVRRALPSSTSTIITATARRRSSTGAATCWSPICMPIR